MKGIVTVDLKKKHFKKIKIRNRYGVGNNVRKFYVSMMKIEPMTHI